MMDTAHRASPDENQPAVLRTLRPDDLPRALELSTEAGWNQNEADWRWLLDSCRGYGIEMPGHGLVGTTMVWEIGTTDAWINMVLVTEACRGRGLARRLMEACLHAIKQSGRRALLDATDLGARVYTKLGFSGEDRIIRLRREAATGTVERDASVRLQQLTEARLPEAVALDHAVLGIDRNTLMQNFLPRYAHAAWWLPDATGRMAGFSIGRDGRTAHQVGPLIAPDQNAARALLLQALSNTPGPVLIDVPAVHTVWLEELQAMGFAPRRTFIRMGLDGAAWPTDWNSYFAMAGPDFA